MSNIGIKELAEIAGVSIATVSRAMSNPTRVSEATREKVIAAAKKAGYTPNRLGAGLRTSKTGNIIVIIPDVSDTFNFGVIKSLEKAASKHGYSVLLGDTQGLRERELAYGEMIKSRQADGIILFSHRLPFALEDESDNALAENFHLPPLVNSCEPVGIEGIPLVSIDNERAAKEATEYLISLGHRDIAVITGHIDTPSSQMRLNGYRSAMAEAGIPCDESLIREGEYSLEKGDECTKELLVQKRRPTAIFCFSDEIALGCLSSLKDNNFSVPGDISVVGFDDIRFAKYVSPSLTTIAQPVEEIGQNCIQQLLNMMNKNLPSGETVILPHKLVVRESTGPVKKN